MQNCLHVLSVLIAPIYHVTENLNISVSSPVCCFYVSLCAAEGFQHLISVF